MMMTTISMVGTTSLTESLATLIRLLPHGNVLYRSIHIVERFKVATSHYWIYK